MMNDVLDLKGFYDISANQKKVVWFDVATCIAGNKTHHILVIQPDTLVLLNVCPTFVISESQWCVWCLSEP